MNNNQNIFPTQNLGQSSNIPSIFGSNNQFQSANPNPPMNSNQSFPFLNLGPAKDLQNTNNQPQPSNDVKMMFQTHNKNENSTSIFSNPENMFNSSAKQEIPSLPIFTGQNTGSGQPQMLPNLFNKEQPQNSPNMFSQATAKNPLSSNFQTSDLIQQKDNPSTNLFAIKTPENNKNEINFSQTILNDKTNVKIGENVENKSTVPEKSPFQTNLQIPAETKPNMMFGNMSNPQITLNMFNPENKDSTSKPNFQPKNENLPFANMNQKNTGSNINFQTVDSKNPSIFGQTNINNSEKQPFSIGGFSLKPNTSNPENQEEKNQPTEQSLFSNLSQNPTSNMFSQSTSQTQPGTSQPEQGIEKKIVLFPQTNTTSNPENKTLTFGPTSNFPNLAQKPADISENKPQSDSQPNSGQPIQEAKSLFASPSGLTGNIASANLFGNPTTSAPKDEKKSEPSGFNLFSQNNQTPSLNMQQNQNNSEVQNTLFSTALPKSDTQTQPKQENLGMQSSNENKQTKPNEGVDPGQNRKSLLISPRRNPCDQIIARVLFRVVPQNRFKCPGHQGNRRLVV